MLTPQSLHTMGSSLRHFLLMNSRCCHHPIGKEQDLTGLPIPSCPLPAFCLWENLAKDKFNQGSEKMQKQRKSKVKDTQSFPTLWDPMDYTVHGILQVRILGWVAIPFSRGSSQPRDQTQVSHIRGGFFTS